MTQPRIRRNEWQALVPPDLGSWTPTLSVSVVVPAYDAGRLLPTVLAGLAAQTYPDHLLEVVVVDDGPGEPGALRLPDVRPANTRLVRPQQGWGRANACHTGALAAEGDVLHWLDADMLVERHEVEAQARWHHLLDHVVVLGDKWFVDPGPALALTPQQVRDAVERDGLAALFGDREPHAWVEEVYDRTDRLRLAGWNALRTHTGATASVGARLYRESGGLDVDLRLGEDIALGSRLAHQGAVFVPDAGARSWHLGRTHVMERRDRVNAYNDPFLAERAPSLRAKRHPGRTYRTPYLEVVLDARGHDAAAVTATVDAVLAGTLHDLSVTLVGPWSTLHDGRDDVLGDAAYDVRVVHTTYADEPRVRLVEETPTAPSDAAFRLVLPGPHVAPRPPALEKALLHLEHTHEGLRLVDLDDGTQVRIERTAAVNRARRLAAPGDDLDDLDDLVREIAGARTMPAKRAGFAPSADVRPRHYPRTGGPPVDGEEAWARIRKTFDAR